MAYNIAFYVHHHGSGHLMRSLAIAAHLANCKITFLGSDLQQYQPIIPEHINCIHLPADTKTVQDDHAAERPLEGLHYAPLNIAGQSARVSVMSKFFADQQQLLLVVDVSVEVAMLATLCGVPSVLVRQHGKRDDLPHILAYKNAIGLLAPYGQNLQPEEQDWLTDKTFFTGGFARFAKQSNHSNEDAKAICVLIGQGGSSINAQFIAHLSDQCADWHIHLIGKIDGIDQTYAKEQITIYGNITDPLTVLKKCSLVIGNAGHNTVMEVAALNKRMIVIPESRPFQEQLVKAQMLEKHDLADVVLPEMLYTTNWPEVLQKLLNKIPQWANTVEESAAENAAVYLKSLYDQQYPLSI